MFFPNKKIYLDAAFFLLFFFAWEGLGAQNEEISLNNISWKYIEQDGANFSFTNIDDENWKKLPKRSSLYAEDADAVWMRAKTFIATTGKRQSLLIEKICAKHQVYLNGKLLAETQASKGAYSRCPRPALHPIPMSFLDTETGESSIAIRLIKEAGLPHLSIKGKIALLPTEKAERYLSKKYLWGLSFGSFSFILGAFFLVLFLGLYRTQEYYSFSIFLFAYALYKIAQNDMLRSLTGSSPFYEHFAQFFSIILAPLFYFFYISFFSIQNFRFSFAKIHIDKDAEKVGNLYLLFSIAFALMASISPNLSQHFKLNALWLLLNIPFFVYYLYTAIQSMKFSLRESNSFLIGASFICLTFLHNALTSENLFWDPEGGAGVFFLELSISIGLLYVLVQRKIEVEKHNTYLKSIDELQDRIFGYIGSILAKPTEQVTALMKELVGKKNKQGFSGEMSETKEKIKDIESNLNSLMELARLEVLNEPEHVDEINLHDFIQIVFAHAKLNCHIRVAEETTIETGLDLMNSSMIYLIDFLKQQEFQNIDLVVKAQGRENIFFHFLAFHDQPAKVREVYKVCSHLTPMRDPRWIKWSIISEIIRVMKGKISLKRIRGRFLRVSITLPRTLRAKERLGLLEREEAKPKSISISYKELEGEAALPRGDNVAKESKTEKDAQKELRKKENEDIDARRREPARSALAFHPQMSIGDLFTLIKYKFTRQRKQK